VGTLGFSAIDFPTPATGYAAGWTDTQQARLYRTLDGGGSWQLLSAIGIDAPIRSMTWFDAQRGLVSPGFQDPGVHRTEDGGLHWTVVSGHSSVRFIPHDGVEAGGVPFSGEFLLRTTDTGLTWVEIVPPLSGPFPGQRDYVTAAARIAGGWVLGGGRNKLLVAQEAGPSGVPPAPWVAAGPVVPVSARPNPLSGTTLLLFENPTRGRVRVDVFDARGARIAALVDAILPGGRSVAPWNGKDREGRAMPAGTYFAKVQTSRGIGSAKLTLMP
jgi:hypothetical protein